MTFQSDLFDAADLPPVSALPQGWRYQPDFIDEAEEAALLEHIASLPLR